MQKFKSLILMVSLVFLFVNNKLFSQGTPTLAVSDTAVVTADNNEEVVSTKPNNDKPTIGILLGVGAAPPNANIGFGYFFSHQLLAYTKFVALTSFDSYNYGINLGVNIMHNRGNSFLWIFEFGTLIEGNEKTYNGHTIKGGLGYKFQMFSEKVHVGINLSLFLLAESHEKAVLVPELELVLGVTI